MSWKIEIKPSAVKSYKKLNSKTKNIIKESLKQLKLVENPLILNNVKALSGKLKGDYRLRKGDYRILFTPDEQEQILYVYAILTREGAYK